ncbi:MAG TPA: flagellar basal body rod C-terminal domain-containing protein, partial [Chloroflexota bacterium]|nr:flagellar basal body rod C-terminal domain-containing protein [Chloroflexota bacterium]
MESDASVTVSLGGRSLVSGGRAASLVTESKKLADGTQIHEVKWAGDYQPAEFDGGQLAGLVQLRDDLIPQQLRQIDLLASTLAGTVNEVHRGGFGIGTYASKVSNFFEPMMGASLSQTGLGHDLVAGTITIGNQTLTIDPLNQSITDVMSQVTAAIDAQPGVTAASSWSLDPTTGRVSLTYGTAVAGTTIKFGGASDSSNLLSLLGLIGASDVNTGTDSFGNFTHQVTGTDAVALVSAASIQLDSAIKADINAIATAAGSSSGLTTSSGPGDNRNALALVALQRGAFAALGSAPFEDFYANSAADLGAIARQAGQSAATQQLLVEHLEARRESLSGVSLDEEATRLIQYQRAYQAAARGISALDEMLDTIITRMGRVGN